MPDVQEARSVVEKYTTHTPEAVTAALDYAVQSAFHLNCFLVALDGIYGAKQGPQRVRAFQKLVIQRQLDSPSLVEVVAPAEPSDRETLSLTTFPTA